jgi:multidrug transporter EmrE-like cation transporter
MQFLFLCFVVLTISTTTNTERVDSCVSDVQIEVPYTLWVGTNVTAVSTVSVKVPQFTTFYDVMKLAEIQLPQEYR